MCSDAQAVTAANAYVTVSSSTYGVEDIVPVGADFYVTTRNVGKPSFRADISVRANSPYYLVIPANGRMNLGIGESGLYMVKDESGNEDVFSGRVYVLKLDIEPVETNVCWKASSCTLKLTDDSYPGSEAVWSSIPDGISGRGNSITFSPNALTPGAYTVTARSGIVANYTDTCIVRVVKPAITAPDEGEVHLFGEELKFVGVVVPDGLPNARYAWNVLQGTCLPATSSSIDFQTTLKSIGDLKVEFSVMVGNLTCRTNRTIKVVRPEVTKLSWKNDHDLTQGFTGGSVIDDPVWIKHRNGPLVKNEPGAYTRNCSAEAELAIEADLPLAHQTYVQVKGSGNSENF